MSTKSKLFNWKIFPLRYITALRKIWFDETNLSLREHLIALINSSELNEDEKADAIRILNMMTDSQLIELKKMIKRVLYKK